jgi:hypothetical protein
MLKNFKRNSSVDDAAICVCRLPFTGAGVAAERVLLVELAESVIDRLQRLALG